MDRLNRPLACVIALVALFVATPAAAQQLFINHGNCSAAGPAKNRYLNCTSTTAVSTIITSVDVGFGPVPDVMADLGIVDLQVGLVSAPTMPAFWQFHSTGCGAGNFLFSSDFVAGPYDCVDIWQGLAGGGGQYGGVAGPVPDGNRARIKYAWAVQPFQAFTVPVGEVYVCRMTMRQAHVNSCTGCSAPVCMVYNQESFSRLTGETVRVTNSDYIGFNGGLVWQGPEVWLNCLGGSPVQQRTWGRVKALYR